MVKIDKIKIKLTDMFPQIRVMNLSISIKQSRHKSLTDIAAGLLKKIKQPCRRSHIFILYSA